MSLDDLIESRQAMLDSLIGGMPDHHRAFLIGFEEGEPDWSLLTIRHVAELPAIRWRQRNLDTLRPEQRSALVASLRSSLDWHV